MASRIITNASAPTFPSGAMWCKALLRGARREGRGKAFVTIREAVPRLAKWRSACVLSTRGARHHAGGSRQGSYGHAPALPLKSPRRDRLFRGISPTSKIDKEMLDLAKHIVQTKSARLNPGQAGDPLRDGGCGHEEESSRPKDRAKGAGEPCKASSLLMDALRKKSIAADRGHDRDEAPARRSGSAKSSGATKKPAPGRRQRRRGTLVEPLA